MSLSLDGARAAVFAIVDGVAALANVPVYDYMRHVTSEPEIKAIMTEAGGRMHFWSVTPAPTATLTVLRRGGAGGCDEANPFGIDVHGFYALQDAVASEKAFLTVAASVFEALRAAKNVAGAIAAGPPNWVEHDHRMLAAVLCHHVRFTFPVRAQLSP